jgi:poly(beta-D-mannuronate) lyase
MRTARKAFSPVAAKPPPDVVRASRAAPTLWSARGSGIPLLLWAAAAGVFWLELAGCGGPQPVTGVIVTTRLLAPYDVAQRRVLFGRGVGRFECPPVVPPVRDLTIEGYYADKDSSMVNSQAMARYREATKPVTAYEGQITTISDVYVRSSPASAAAGRCALDWLEAWAVQGALLGRASQQGTYVRTWGLSAIAASYIKIRQTEGLEAAKTRKVEEWIRHLADEVTSYYSTHTGPDVLNSQAYWAGQSSILAGVAINDKELFGWGIERYRLGVSQIQEDGTLPLELARKSKARYYHNFALMPLVQIAEVAARNGIDLYSERNGAVRRLAGRVIETLDDPGFFEGLTSARQDWQGELSGASLVWAEPYFARFEDPRLVPWLRRFRHLRNPWFGGDATLLYGVSALPGAAG